MGVCAPLAVMQEQASIREEAADYTLDGKQVLQHDHRLPSCL